MNSILRWAAVGGCLSLLGACSTYMGLPSNADLANSIGAPDSGTPFQSALHQEYGNLAKIEYGEADWGNANYFADRAKAAAAGQTIAPTEVSARTIEKGRVDEATSVRNRVVAALGGDTTTRNPQMAAHAQAMFDCWLEEVDERNQPSDEASCRTEMNSALAQLGQPVAAAPTPSRPAPATAPARPALVFFDWDKSDINASAQPTLDSIGNTIKNTKPQRVVIAGHADRSGPDSYNMKLSQRRADAVANALASKGADRKNFQVEAYGETRPLVQTADGVREPQNRRVEVTIEQPTAMPPGS